ncbi:hypothetical protein H4R26_001378 [Coemansia thaxteri]|uniref:Uncharacterized protein n=1 Tax=Coemansia thaxteri TaxID=2663907 RepID=A0A9W8BG41_9FUNG|nr:hypothetical protein H4R26_001378 [Coemansia thaxteri]KAJ2487185.1 hypothetical protein EV174_000666 [Coemansia sp. RSA 2320]
MEPVVEWDVGRVVRWFSQNGFPGYDSTLKENCIDGEVLVNLDHESLKDLGIRALGKRLLVLKSIYFLKLQHDIPITSESYVPQTVDVEPDYAQGSSYQRKHRRQTEETISRLLEEIASLSSEMGLIRADMQRIYRLSILENKPLPPPQSHSSNDPFAGAVIIPRRNQPAAEHESRREGKPRFQTPTPVSTGISVPAISTLVPAMVSSPGPASAVSTFSSPLSASSATGVPSMVGGTSSLLLSGALGGGSPSSSQTPVTPHIRVYSDNALQRENEAYKSFRISADDPCSTILPHALKKYHIFDSWHNYLLCIQYGSASKGKFERVLALDERPLILFQQLKDAGESPVFVLKKKSSNVVSADGAGAHQIYGLGVRGVGGGGSRTSLFSSTDNNASSSSLELPMVKGSGASASISGSTAVTSSSGHEFDKL